MVQTPTPNAQRPDGSAQLSMVLASRTPSEDLTPPITLASVLKAFEAKGAVPPVAIALALVDDVLSAFDRFGNALVALDAVMIEPNGHASSGVAPSLSSVSSWLWSLLGAGLGEDWVPAPVRALLGRLDSRDELDRPRDPEELRGWLRDSLGSPASHEEVHAAVERMRAPEVPSLAPVSLPPAPAPAEAAPESISIAPSIPLAPTASLAPAGPEPVADPPAAPDSAPISLTPDPLLFLGADAPTVAESYSAPILTSSALPIEDPVLEPEPVFEPDPLPDEHEAVTEVPASSPIAPHVAPPSSPRALEARAPTVPAVPASDEPNRIVVRRDRSDDRPVSLHMAPAARKSAAPVLGRDSIILPAERRGSPWWLFVIALAAGAIYALFFRS